MRGWCRMERTQITKQLKTKEKKKRAKSGKERKKKKTAAPQRRAFDGSAQRSIRLSGNASLPDRAENDFAIMRCCARVVPLRIVNKELLDAM